MNSVLEMHEFSSYVKRTRFGSFTTELRFDRFVWNQYDIVLAGLPRSNNLVKGWPMVFIY